MSGTTHFFLYKSLDAFHIFRMHLFLGFPLQQRCKFFLVLPAFPHIALPQSSGSPKFTAIQFYLCERNRFRKHCIVKYTFPYIFFPEIPLILLKLPSFPLLLIPSKLQQFHLTDKTMISGQADLISDFSHSDTKTLYHTLP